ncbi:MAG: peptide chain release factor N(5)-glutamine methyltransferase [Roseinatronobacter sp.]
MRAQALLADGVARLRADGVDGAAQDARWLLAHALGVAQDRLTLALGDPVPPEAQARFHAAIMARLARQPVAQIIGTRLFWGRCFRVTPDVLDPRPETETLVAKALEEPFSRVLDLGTGSGAILLSLLADRPEAQGLGVDLSPAALRIARENAACLGLDARVELSVSDWFGAVQGVFDLVVSNPPYIAAPDHATLAPETRIWEPEMALVPAGCDGTGLAAYRRIAAAVRPYLAPGGRVCVEIGLGQGDAVAGLLAQAGLVDISAHADMTGRTRVIAARAPAG